MRIAKLPDDRYPAISDLRRRAKKRIPFFAWEYLDSATGEEAGMARASDALGKITLVPRFMKGLIEPKVETELFGRTYSAPFGIPPIGYTSLMWPYAEQALAKTAAKHSIPHCLSTVASDTPENCGPLAEGNGWFQLYPPRQEHIRTDLLDRAKDCGYSALVVTADVPWPSMRERQRRAGITIPPKTTPRILFHILQRPKWAYRTLKRGKPSFAIMEKYFDESDLNYGKELGDFINFVGAELGGVLDWEYFAKVRDQWDGPLILKGILSTEDAKQAVKAGADAIWVSNHGGRQLEAAPAPIDVLPDIVKAINGKARIIFDSGVRSGGDIVRAIALGADFVFAGRAFMYGIAALGESGGDHVYEVLYHDLINNMHQLGIETLEEMREIEIRYA